MKKHATSVLFASPMSSYPAPYRTAVLGTGYAARTRALYLASDPRCRLIGFTGHATPGIERFQAESGLPAFSEDQIWDKADLVFICTVNRDHGRLVRRALEHKLHVVVEYPLALNLEEAAALIALAKKQNRLLHVEHIELISGIHLALKQALPEAGAVHFARYGSINPRAPEPQRWTFSPELFGFPLTGALSRISRLVDLIGPVRSVYCQNRYLEMENGYYRGCLCTAQLAFVSGAQGLLTYARGAGLWLAENRIELTGTRGSLVHDGQVLTLTNSSGTHPFEPGSRRGLFDQDSRAVLDHLSAGSPLYVRPEQTLHALAVATAAERSARSGTVEVV